jgi:hypothetical protein
MDTLRTMHFQLTVTVTVTFFVIAGVSFSATPPVRTFGIFRSMRHYDGSLSPLTTTTVTLPSVALVLLAWTLFLFGSAYHRSRFRLLLDRRGHGGKIRKEREPTFDREGRERGRNATTVGRVAPTIRALQAKGCRQQEG